MKNMMNAVNWPFSVNALIFTIGAHARVSGLRVRHENSIVLYFPARTVAPGQIHSYANCLRYLEWYGPGPL